MSNIKDYYNNSSSDPVLCNICGLGDNINWIKEPSKDGYDNDDRHVSWCNTCGCVVCTCCHIIKDPDILCPNCSEKYKKK
jgi:hypothetical protein